MTPPDPVGLDVRLSALELNSRAERLHSRPGGGDPPSGMEPRIARLEAAVSHIERDIADIRTDLREIRGDIKGLVKADESNFRTLQGAAEFNFRLLFAALIAVALGLAGLMAKGFHWL